MWTNAISAGPPSALTVRFFDVGQGDSALLTSPAGVAILVDGGPDPAQVATELAALGVKRLDLIVASHPHADHVVGLPAVLARFPVGLLLEPGCRDDSPDGAALDEAASGEHIAVRHPRAGDVLQVGDVRLEILSPDRCWSGTESDTNNDAIVVRASIGEDSVLFATEPEEPAQQVLLDEGVDLHADVLKVPHHGAATSIEPFFEAVDAEVAVVSVGPNTYGHPVPEVLDWIRATGAEVFRTDRAGTVTVTFERWRGGCRVRRVSPSAAKAAPVYLLWGEDGFLLREAALELLGDLRPVEVDGGLWQGGETADLATPSLFGERRALLVSDAKALPDEGVRELAGTSRRPTRTRRSCSSRWSGTGRRRRRRS